MSDLAPDVWLKFVHDVKPAHMTAEEFLKAWSDELPDESFPLSGVKLWEIGGREAPTVVWSRWAWPLAHYATRASTCPPQVDARGGWAGYA